MGNNVSSKEEEVDYFELGNKGFKLKVKKLNLIITE